MPARLPRQRCGGGGSQERRRLDGFGRLQLGDHALCGIWIIPKARPGHLRVELDLLVALGGQVKESPGGQRSGPEAIRVRRMGFRKC